uniref:CCD39 protein n=1 Tax=Haemonchus contortus TaxID=6289 RepID=A0A7I4Z2K9_HAECO
DLLAGSLEEASTPRKSESSRVRELESELRIAKEVSVRLHTELEQTEEKSSRLEDEVSSMREKVWELQTQNKWREPRNKADIITEWEQNHKCVREFEIKYKKLESIFNREREVINDERTQKKNNITLLKKIAADAETSPEEARHELEKKEVVWKFAETSLEKEIAYLKKQLSGSSVEEGNEHDKPALHDLDAGKTLSSVLRDSEQTLLEEIKKRLSHYEEKYSEIEAQLEKMRSHNEELLEQLNKTKFEWQKDKEAQQHKARQTEKIRLVEMDALRQKFSSRMRIMEDTNKSLHSQLILVRRERDTQRKALSSFERQVLEDHKKNDTRDKEISRAQEKIEFMQKRLSAVEAELERANTDLRITKEARRADQILWKINRARGGKETLSSGDFRAIEQLQSHFQEYERFYVKETERLNKILTSMSEELQEQKNSNAAEIIAKLRQQERVLEIKQKKLAQKKDVQAVASETLEAGTSRLEQLQFVSEPVHCNGKSEYDGNSDEMRYIISQLIAIMDEDTQTLLPSDEPTHPWIDWIGHAPSGSECEASYENISQSPTSIRSVVSMPTRSSFCTETRRGYEYQGHLSIQRRHSNLSEYLGGISEQRKECVDENVRREFEPKEPESSNAYLTVTRTFSFDGAKEQLINKKSGNSILCRVRREELARGGEPSVRLMARAFETIDTCTPVRQKFFSIRKSRSVESAQGRSHFESSSHPSISMHNNSQSDTVHEPAYETLPREGRSTLKNMGSKLVNRVRRSLSRSRGGDKECREGAELKAEGARTKKDLCSILLEETRNRSAEKKTQKSGS